MPRYHDKMRLKRYMMKHGECDPLTEYLICKGFNDGIVETGLEIFVDSWEEAVKWAIGNYDSADIDYDLYQRTELYQAMKHVSPEQIAPYAERIEKADNYYKEHTVENSIPHDSYIDEDPDRKVHWWLFRSPKIEPGK